MIWFLIKYSSYVSPPINLMLNIVVVFFFTEKWDPEEKDGVDSKYHIIHKGTFNQEEGYAHWYRLKLVLGRLPTGWK